MRAANDLYPTPPRVAAAICERLRAILPNNHAELIEPSAGTGSFLTPLRSYWAGKPLTAIDISADENALRALGADVVHQGDWVQWVTNAQLQSPTLVVGNPPFSLAEEHINAGLNYLPQGSHICFLLKLNFLGGKRRARTLWSRRQLRYTIPLLGRPSFVDGDHARTDFNEYGIFVWQLGFTGNGEHLLPHLDWKGLP